MDAHYEMPTDPRFQNLTGQTFGRLTVVGFDHTKNPRLGAWWRCSCSCGETASVKGTSLRSGRTRSCGCLKKEVIAAGAHSVHGATTEDGKSPEYVVWSHMIARCTNPNDKRYARYGGRGIVVCDEWLKDFARFLADMGPRPSPDHTIDRIDNDGPYSAANCRWATRKEQNRNTSTNRMVTAFGQTRCLAEWAEITGIHRETVRDRLNRGWDAERAVTP